MIILTVGTQLPFDRLVKVIDEIAPSIEDKIFGQIGPSGYVPRNFEHRSSMSPREFESMISESRLIISHAGIGTMLTARRLGKPIVLFPRKASLKEHRNDHQMATAKQMEGRRGIQVIYDEYILQDRLLNNSFDFNENSMEAGDRASFISRLKQFIDS